MKEGEESYYYKYKVNEIQLHHCLLQHICKDSKIIYYSLEHSRQVCYKVYYLCESLCIGLQSECRRGQRILTEVNIFLQYYLLYFCQLNH